MNSHTRPILSGIQKYLTFKPIQPVAVHTGHSAPSGHSCITSVFQKLNCFETFGSLLFSTEPSIVLQIQKLIIEISQEREVSGSQFLQQSWVTTHISPQIMLQLI